MGIMDLWHRDAEADEMARAKAKPIDAATISKTVRQLTDNITDAAAFKTISADLAKDRSISAAEVIEIAHKFAGVKAKTKKAAITAIGRERLRIVHSKAKADSASKAKTW